MKPIHTALAALFLASSALAQQPVSPDQVPEAVRKSMEDQQRQRAEAARLAAEAANKPRPAPVITSTNPTVTALATMLTGTFRSEGSADGKTPALVFASAVVNIEGLDNAVYFEVFRADSPADPFRQGVFHVWMKKGQPVLRQYSFLAQGAEFGRAIAGMWMAPEVFPHLKADRLAPAVDVPLAADNQGGYAGTAQAPTSIGGAREFSSRWSLSPNALTFLDRGYDGDGNLVWGSDYGLAPNFHRSEITTAVDRRGGVVVYDVVASSSEPKLVNTFEAYAHATAWSIEGNEVYNSRTMSRDGGAIQPFRMMIPGGMPAGFQTGIEGLAVGTVRRIYLPAGLAWGQRPPRQLSKLGANMDSVWQLETIYVGKAPEADLPPPTPAAVPAVPLTPVVTPK